MDYREEFEKECKTGFALKKCKNCCSDIDTEKKLNCNIEWLESKLQSDRKVSKQVIELLSDSLRAERKAILKAVDDIKTLQLKRFMGLQTYRAQIVIKLKKAISKMQGGK